MKFSYLIKSIGLTSLLVGLSLTTAQAATVAIHNCTELQNIDINVRMGLDFDYVLANDIDCSATNPLNEENSSSIWGKNPFYKGFTQIRGIRTTFDGQNHTISNLYGISLFGVLSKNAVIKNLKLKNSFSSYDMFVQVGFLAAESFGAKIINVHVQGTMFFKSMQTVGGLIGSGAAYIYQSSANVNIVGENGEFGGLVGTFYGGVISQCKAEGQITAGESVGGLIGLDWTGMTQSGTEGIIRDSYSTVNITLRNVYYPNAKASAGGIVGMKYKGDKLLTISNTYFAGTINNVVGNNFYIGGLFGYNEQPTNTYIISSYFNGDILNQVPVAMTYKTESKRNTVALKKKVTFMNWNFKDVWEINEGVDAPSLIWEKINPGVGISGADLDRKITPGIGNPGVDPDRKWKN